MRTYYSQEQCESRACWMLIRFQRQLGTHLALPVDVDLLGELTCGLTWDWADIDEPEGTTIWARLVPSARRVDLNERRAATLNRVQGLDRFTRAHEIGHWDLHATQPNPQQLSLLEAEPAPEVTFCRGRDESWPERQADWYAAALLMPPDLFPAAARRFDLTRWDDMREMKKLCNVSWQALSIRLETFAIPYVDHTGAMHGG